MKGKKKWKKFGPLCVRLGTLNRNKKGKEKKKQLKTKSWQKGTTQINKKRD